MSAPATTESQLKERIDRVEVEIGKLQSDQRQLGIAIESLAASIRAIARAQQATDLRVDQLLRASMGAEGRWSRWQVSAKDHRFSTTTVI